MGDHESEVKGGDAERTFKLPNPVYFLPYQRHHRFEQGDDELQEILQVHGANYLSASDVGQRPLTPIAVWIVDVCQRRFHAGMPAEQTVSTDTRGDSPKSM